MTKRTTHCLQVSSYDEEVVVLTYQRMLAGLVAPGRKAPAIGMLFYGCGGDILADILEFESERPEEHVGELRRIIAERRAPPSVDVLGVIHGMPVELAGRGAVAMRYEAPSGAGRAWLGKIRGGATGGIEWETGLRPAAGTYFGA